MLDQDSGIPDLARLLRRKREPSAPPDAETIHRRAVLAAQTAVDFKAEDVRVLDMRELVTYTDYLVICTGRNVRLTKRIAEEVGLRLKKQEGVVPSGVEGFTQGEWILLDFMDFVVHVFTPAAREFYRLDVLWKQAPTETVGP
ncbi:MAG: ribosome silencing factor [Thermoleophilia bacterium]|nr:ribosome silencing factor [Thermoleophilia bacterium]